MTVKSLMKELFKFIIPLCCTQNKRIKAINTPILSVVFIAVICFNHKVSSSG